MHADEVETSPELVRRLLAAQFPQRARLPIRAVRASGTDHALYRLGETLVVRLPRIAGPVGQAEKEQRWLPWLAPRLPLAIPAPLALGAPAEGYPFPWSVYRWLDGENAYVAPLADLPRAARQLAEFIAALQAIDPARGPAPGPGNSHRGEPLRNRDAATREMIALLSGDYDAGALTAAWEAALGAPPWVGPPRWIHGDLLPVNLLVRQGRLSAVIDFGCLGVGDPASDLQPAWNLLTAATRPIFREALAVDDAAWARGRGWSLTVALVALPYYRETNPTLAAISRRAITEVLSEKL
jgi:aminoglycoside phosphotransferase (APT) family kinase protein